MEDIIELILSDMRPFIGLAEQRELQASLIKHLANVRFEECYHGSYDYTKMFLEAKKIEGMSDYTIRNYLRSIEQMKLYYQGDIVRAGTEDIRSFLLDYREKNSVSKATLDTLRRNLSSFYNWLEVEGYIIKSPMKRIHKIKATKIVKKAFSDEEIELLRDSCKCPRDLAIVDMLYATGVRISELISLDRDNVDFENRECMVLGKGDKERMVYFDAKTKLHLQEYLASREDNNPALFVGLIAPYSRLCASAVERRIRELGRSLEIEKCHPHKFRTSCATHAIDKGMPIEQVQHLLGHEDISTTMRYALVKEENVKASHKKYLS